MIETYAMQASGFNGIFDRVGDLEDTPIAENYHGDNMMTPMIGLTPSNAMMGTPGAASTAMTPMMTPAGMQS